MTLDRFKLVAAVHVFFVDDEQILMLRRRNTGYEDGNYSVPAGHVDGNETIRNAAKREAREETSVEVAVDDFQLAHVMHRNAADAERIDFFLVTTDWQGEPTNAEPDKCDDLSWFPIDQLPPNTVPYVRAAIGHFRDGVSYSEFGWK